MRIKTRPPRMVWIGLGMGVGFWLLESVIHTFVFGSGPLTSTLLCERDPNELWMRGLLTAMFAAFGQVADRSVRAERHLKEDALRLNRLLRFVDRLNLSVQHSGDSQVAPAPSDHPGSPRPGGPKLGSRADDPHAVGELALGADEIAALTRRLQQLSSFVDFRFNELYVLLQLTHEINQGYLLDEVLNRAYDTLQSIIPYHRLSVALLEDEGRVARARWARADHADLHLPIGYSAPVHGSSLQQIIESGEARILNDLPEYLEAHPESESTRLVVAEGIRASLTCPLISMGKPVGFIFFSSRDAYTYTEAHVDLLKLIAGHVSVVVEKSDLYQQVLQEKQKSEALLLNVMPDRIARRLQSGEETVAESFPEIAILFADIVGFTESATHFTPEGLIAVLRDLFVRFDALCDRHGVEKIKTVGDTYVAISAPGHSDANNHVRSMALFALDMIREAERVWYPDRSSLGIRIGMHAGPVVAGVIGQKKFAYDIWGDAVNVASRMETTGECGRIQVTDEIRTALQHEFVFECRGLIEVKGRGRMTTYFLTSQLAGARSRAASEGERAGD